MLPRATLVATLLASQFLVNAQSLTPAAQAFMPIPGNCPEDFSLVREVGTSNQTLSSGEASYVAARKSDVLPGAWKSYLSTVQGTNISLPSYVSAILNGSSSEQPTLGIAQSGGGYRAALVGAGVMNALDVRNNLSIAAGTGGLLQAATYITALSGGNWLLTSLVQADFPTLPDLVYGSGNPDEFAGWLFQDDLFAPNGSESLIGELLEELAGKAAMGYPITFIDFWARALSRHFVNGTTAATFLDETTTHGSGVTFSSLRNMSSFQSHQIPFPVVVADSVSNQQNNSNLFPVTGIAALTNPIYEMNLYEFGTWDPMLAAFIPMEYLGSRNSSVCITGFDQASYIEATSSAFWRQVNISGVIENAGIAELFAVVQKYYPTDNKTYSIDLAPYPNPFQGMANGTFIDTNESFLNMFDGGDDGENVPFQPLLIKSREVDTIFAIDVSGDTVDNFANGRSLIATQDRVAFFNGTYSFPPVPTNASTFVAQNLTTRPTFFGCNETDLSVPLVIYVANGAPPPGQPPITNTTVFETNFTMSQVEGIMSQAFTFAIQGIANQTSTDREWPACLACAVVDRARAREGAERSGVCADCFSRYCWNGQEVTATNISGSAPASSAGRITSVPMLVSMAAVAALVAVTIHV